MANKQATEHEVTIVTPCKNESAGIGAMLEKLKATFPDFHVIVVDDGSTDDSATVAGQTGATVIRHPYSMGNGAAIKTGLRAAETDIVVCMDSDGQHDPAEIRKLLASLDSGFDMAVGARSPEGQANTGRQWANAIYNRFAGLMVGHKVPDLTSGFRAMRREKGLEFIHLLPNGFSYPTTLTMAFFRAGYSVAYVPIEAHPRKGKSHISMYRDGIRFLLIIFKVGTLYSPLKVFFPMSVMLFLLGIGYYLFTYLTAERFTNMGALLFLSSVVVFLMGLVSEQITSLIYQSGSRNQRY